MEPIIDPDERLFRAVKFIPHLWDDETGRPSSALFKDSKGVSVDRDGGRPTEKIVGSYLNMFGEEKVRAVVFLEAWKCFQAGTYIKYTPSRRNKFHAEIHRSPNQIELTKSQQRFLAKNCIFVFQRES